MRKTQRILILALTMVMILGTIAPSFAMSNNLVANDNNKSKTRKEDIINKLVEDGYIKGYADGSLGLDKNITRAEFTAIIVRALGLENMVKSTQNIPTGFKDVDTNSWYNPYVNIATNQNIIFGYPDKTFKPENDVKYQEAITMMVRMVLSDNKDEILKVDNGGKYPMNYFLKANELGLLEGVKIDDIKQTAQRGSVFLVMNNAIELMEDKDTVEVDALVLGKDKNNLKVSVLKGEGFKEKDVLNVKAEEKDVNKMSVGKVYTIKINENNEITSIKENNNSKTVSGAISKDKNKLKIDGKNYDSKDLVKLIYNDEDKEFKSFPAKIDFAKATLYYGKLVYVNGYNFEEIIPIEEVKNNKVYGITKSGTIKITNITKDTEIFLVKDGEISEIKLDGIKVGDIAHIQRKGKKSKLFITNEREKGKLEDFDTKKNTIKIGDKECKLETGRNSAILSQGRKYSSLSDMNRLKGIKDSEIEVSFNLNGNVQLVKADKDLLTYTKAIVEQKDRDRLLVLTEDGYKESFYVTEMTELINGKSHNRRDREDRNGRYIIENIMSQIDEGDVIKVLVDGRGDVEEVQILENREGEISYIDEAVVEFDNRDQYLSDDFVIFSDRGNSYKIIDFYDLSDIFYKNKDVKVKSVIFEDEKLVEAIVIKEVSEGTKKELIELVAEGKKSIEVANKYKENQEVQKSIESVQKLIDGIEVELAKLTDKEIENYKKALTKEIDILNQRVLNEILFQLENKLTGVKENDVNYSKEGFEEINKFVENTKNLKVENCPAKIKEAEDLLTKFDEIIYKGLIDLQKEINKLDKEVREEIKIVKKVMNRAIYNEPLANNYKTFLEGLKREIKNIKDEGNFNTWNQDYLKRKEDFHKNKFNLEGRSELEIKVFGLEEKIDVANSLLEQIKKETFEEKAELQKAVKSANSFINNYKRNKNPEKVDMENLEEITAELTKTIADVSAKLNISNEELFKDSNLETLKARIYYAEIVKADLVEEGRADEALALNNLLLEVKANIYAGQTDSKSVDRMIGQIDSFLEGLSDSNELPASDDVSEEDVPSQEDVVTPEKDVSNQEVIVIPEEMVDKED